MKKIILLILFSLPLAGCSGDSLFQGMSDDESYKAVIEEASIALDDKDYSKAINTLISVYDTTNPDPEVSRLMGSAYMGKVGIDVTYLLSSADDSGKDSYDKVMDLLVLNATTGTSSSESTECDLEDLTLLMILDDARFIDGVCMEDMMSYVNKAKRVFDILDDFNRMNNNDRIRYGIVSSIHFSLSLSNAVGTALKRANTDPVNIPVPINKAAYVAYKNETPWNVRYYYQWPYLGTLDAGASSRSVCSSTSIDTYKEDLIAVNTAISTLNQSTSDQNYIKDTLTAYLGDILEGSGISSEISVDAINNMTTTGLFTYLNTLAAE